MYAIRQEVEIKSHGGKITFIIIEIFLSETSSLFIQL
jgi:hypothetical protein